MASLVLTGLQRWFMFAVMGLVFPFLIVRTTKLKISSALHYNTHRDLHVMLKSWMSFLSQDALSSYLFLLFACVCMLGSLYTFFLLPETKGKTLLEISEEFKAITVCGKSFAEETRTETRLWWGPRIATAKMRKEEKNYFSFRTRLNDCEKTCFANKWLTMTLNNVTIPTIWNLYHFSFCFLVASAIFCLSINGDCCAIRSCTKFFLGPRFFTTNNN